MPTDEVTVPIDVSEGATVAELEPGIAEHLRKADRKLLTAGMAALEEEAVRRDSCCRHRPRPLDLLTCLGWVRLECLYVGEARKVLFRYPLKRLHTRRMPQAAGG